jgi:hypothetical protein
MKFTTVVLSSLCISIGFALPIRAIEPVIDSAASSPLISQANWQSYNSEDGRFAVQLPSEPETQPRSITIAGEPTAWVVFRTADDAGVYAVAYSDLSPTVIEAGKDVVIRSIQGTLINELNWQPLNTSGNPISIAGYPGREYIGVQNNELSVLRLVLADRRLYAVISTSADLERISQFLNSFAVLSWQPYTSDEGRFSVNFPLSPEESITDSEEIAGREFIWTVIESRNFTAPDDIYAVAYTDVSPEDLQQGEAALLDRVGTNIIEELQPQTAFESGQEISLNGNPGRSYLVTTQTGRLVAMHLYLVGQRLYGVGVRSNDITTVNQFLGSFQVEER